MKKLLPYFLIVFLIFIDQIVKYWVLTTNKYSYLNSGFIFGLGRNFDLFLWISCIVIVILFIFSIKKSKPQTYNLFVILAAALSNLIDRILCGGVIDYWRINYFGVEIFFNLADILLILGVAFYAWQVGKENSN